MQRARETKKKKKRGWEAKEINEPNKVVLRKKKTVVLRKLKTLMRKKAGSAATTEVTSESTPLGIR